MTDNPSGLTLLPEEVMAEADKRTTIVTLDLEAPQPALLGRALYAIEVILETLGIKGTITAPGYERTFYGWDEKQ